jgi:hypothetical protein
MRLLTRSRLTPTPPEGWVRARQRVSTLREVHPVLAATREP